MTERAGEPFSPTPAGNGLGTRLRDARLRAGLSQAALADRAQLGGGQSIVARYERGAQRPSVQTLLQLAEVLEVRLDELAGSETGANEPVEVRGPGGNVPVYADDSISDIDQQAFRSAWILTEELTMAWNRGRFAGMDELRATAREIARAYPAAGRGFVEGWLRLFDPAEGK